MEAKIANLWTQDSPVAKSWLAKANIRGNQDLPFSGYAPYYSQGRGHQQTEPLHLKIHYGFKPGGMAKMGRASIKRELLAVFMERPLYFNIPLRKRLEFLKLFSAQPVPQLICEYTEHLIGGGFDFEAREFAGRDQTWISPGPGFRLP